MTATLPIALSNPSSAAADDYILIEQEPWGKDVGRTSLMQGLVGIKAAVYGTLFPPANCGGLDGFDTPVYVYPSRSDLNFVFAVIHGEFVPCTVQTLIRDEIVQCGFKASAELKYPCQGTPSLQWLGQCYDPDGNIVPRPNVTIAGRELQFDGLVYGSLRARYSVLRKTYNVRVEERDDSIENNFDSVAYCVWTGGVKWKELSPPSGYDEHHGNCGNGIYDDGSGGDSAICSPTGKRYPTAVRADRHTKKDYCSQVVESDEITESTDYDKDTQPCHDPDTPYITD